MISLKLLFHRVKNMLKKDIEFDKDDIYKYLFTNFYNAFDQ